MELNGEPGGTRTRDHRIKSAMLYQLSYRPLREHDETRLCEHVSGGSPIVARHALLTRDDPAKIRKQASRRRLGRLNHAEQLDERVFKQLQALFQKFVGHLIHRNAGGGQILHHRAGAVQVFF
jgi:hypothetical protein